MTENKETDYRAAQELTKYQITPDPEPESEHKSEGVRIITGLAPTVQKLAVVPVNQMKQGKWLKHTLRAPKGSPPVLLKGEGSRPQPECPQPEESQPESQPEPPQPEQSEEEEERPWVHKPFTAVIANYRQIKDQYVILERTLESISFHLDMEPRHLLEHIQTLPKPQDLTDLQARVDCLLKENRELRTKVEEGEVLRKETEELKDQITALEAEVKSAREERDKAKEVARKIHAFIGYPGDVINKARLYDQCVKQPKTASGAKIMLCMVDYSTKMEKLLKELRALLQPIGVQPEPASTSTPTPGPSTVPIPNLSPDVITPPAHRPDPLLQEAIPEINTEDIASLKTWAVEGLETLTTPITGNRGTNFPGNLSTPGSVSQEALRRTEEQTKRRAKESISESGSSEEKEEEEDPISLTSDEEEYQGSDTPSDMVDKPKTPPFHINRPTTRLMPRGPTTHPKRKAVRKNPIGETRMRRRR